MEPFICINGVSVTSFVEVAVIIGDNCVRKAHHKEEGRGETIGTIVPGPEHLGALRLVPRMQKSVTLYEVQVSRYLGETIDSVSLGSRSRRDLTFEESQVTKLAACLVAGLLKEGCEHALNVWAHVVTHDVHPDESIRRERQVEKMRGGGGVELNLNLPRETKLVGSQIDNHLWGAELNASCIHTGEPNRSELSVELNLNIPASHILLQKVMYVGG
uniref:Uncharacterized protein n=1 Tax=Timema monikensis TaxID=170555 RepID=A0A7R9DYD2_9NEOP|nr:unnamed protein product [Timema monikensis]